MICSWYENDSLLRRFGFHSWEDFPIRCDNRCVKWLTVISRDYQKSILFDHLKTSLMIIPPWDGNEIASVKTLTISWYAWLAWPSKWGFYHIIRWYWYLEHVSGRRWKLSHDMINKTRNVFLQLIIILDYHHCS